MNKAFWYIYGWLVFRPISYCFLKMVWSTEPKGFRKGWDNKLQWPNYFWWFMYITVFNFFCWCYHDAWRPLCTWDKFLKHKPWYAKLIHWLGSYTAGSAISGGRCMHCGREDGCPVDLSQDETGKTFILDGTQSFSTQEGVDHRFWGITICPCCGHRAEYSDGSL